uniref:Uncharacterized protein n=1 Tax=Cacopsylla melanoneura TaxID=428564 RepID=A0A8D9A6B2_9HEMI
MNKQKTFERTKTHRNRTFSPVELNAELIYSTLNSSTHRFSSTDETGTSIGGLFLGQFHTIVTPHQLWTCLCQLWSCSESLVWICSESLVWTCSESLVWTYSESLV